MYKIDWGKKLKKLEKNINKLADKTVEVGFFPDSGYHEEAEMPLVNLMAIHELRDDSHQRPLFTIMSLKYQGGRGTTHFKNIASRFISNSVKSNNTSRKFYNEVGAMVKNDISNQFGKTISQGGLTVHSNTPATIKAKGKNTPLVDTGKLKAGLLFKVKKKGG